jgi:hypothetical protein
MSAVTASCSKAEATAVVQRLHLGEADFIPNPVNAVLCGGVLGPGSKTMVVSLASGGTSVPFEGWAVFRLAGAEWQLVLRQNNGAQISAAGNDIRETRGVSRPGDPRCCPSGGTEARLWHWNGTRFGASPWRQATRAKPGPTTVHLFYINSPSRNIWCDVGDEDMVFCVSRTLPHSATLRIDGTVRICSGRRCVGSTKPFKPGGDPILEYGQQDVQSAYSCKSEQVGITCTVRSGRARGKGFLINRDGVTRVGP